MSRHAVVPFDSAVNVAFPAIIRAFALPIPAIQWVVIAYTLTYAALMLVFGRLGDMLGHRRVFLLGTGCSAAAFLGCAAAPSLPWLLVARVAQGVGAALALSCGPALATGLYPELQRAGSLACTQWFSASGSAAGSLLAGVLVQRFGWQSVFWFRAPLSLAAFMLAWGLPVALPTGPRERFDAIGAATAGPGDRRVIARAQSACSRAACAAPFLVLFVAGGESASSCGNAAPRFRSSIWAISATWISALLNAGNVMVSLAGFSVPLLVPFFLDRVAGLAAPQVGAMLAVSSLGTALAAPAAGGWRDASPRGAWRWRAQARPALGQVLIGTAGRGAGPAGLRRLDVLARRGLGLFQVAYFEIATATLPRENAASPAAL